MWSVLKERLEAAQEGQQTMQIHQDLVFDHAVAQAKAEVILSGAQSELATIKHIQADWKLAPSDPGHEGPPSEPHNKELPNDHEEGPDSQGFQDLI